jgi:hypothetical protein
MPDASAVSIIKTSLNQRRTTMSKGARKSLVVLALGLSSMLFAMSMVLPLAMNWIFGFSADTDLISPTHTLVTFDNTGDVPPPVAGTNRKAM